MNLQRIPFITLVAAWLGLTVLAAGGWAQTASFGGNTYTLITAQNIQDARGQAGAMGGYLAAVGSSAENAFLAQTFVTPTASAVIGFSDEASEGAFMWDSGEAIVYTNWAPGEPNNAFGNEDYTQIRSDGTWNDIDPSATFPAIVEVPAPFDVGVTSIDSPVSVDPCGGVLGASETVTVTVTNFGGALAVGSAIIVEFTVDGAQTTSEVISLPVSLVSMQTFSYAFTGTADLSMASSSIITARTIGSDADPSNDGISASVTTSAPFVALPYFEDFGTGFSVPPCWVNVQGENAGGQFSDWVITSAPTPTSNTGPPADHTTGVVGQGSYVHIEDSNPNANYAAVSLRLPPLDFRSIPAPGMTFWIHSHSADGAGAPSENHLSVDVTDLGTGVKTTDVQGAPIGHLADAWNVIFVDLSAFAGSIVSIEFRGRNDNNDHVHDIAIDDVRVFETGQAPQPGVAVLDINGAVNPGNLPVSSGSRGPYSSIGTTGGLMNLHFEGEVNQPIILIAGSLNVNAAMYAGYGQLDLGGPNLTGLTIVADGSRPTFPDLFFRIGPTGSLDLSFPIPATAAGLTNGYQAIVYNTTNLIGFSNAVELSVM